MKIQNVDLIDNQAKCLLDISTATKNIGTHKVLENEKFSVWQIHLAPGEELAAHLHDRPYFWTILSSGTARAYYNNGDVVDVQYNQGDTRYFPDLIHENSFAHTLINTGQTPLIFVTVEFNNPEFSRNGLQ